MFDYPLEKVNRECQVLLNQLYTLYSHTLHTPTTSNRRKLRRRTLHPRLLDTRLVDSFLSGSQPLRACLWRLVPAEELVLTSEPASLSGVQPVCSRPNAENKFFKDPMLPGRSAESMLQRPDILSFQRSPRNLVPLSLRALMLRPCSTGRCIPQVAKDPVSCTWYS